MTPCVDGDQNVSVRPRRRFIRLTALGVTVGMAAAAVVGSTGASAAAKPISQSAGRFLTGTAAGQSFDSVAALNGEKAEYPGDPGPNQNDLSGSVLGQALSSPLGNISVPFPGGVTFGAVGQYAAAKKDGSASASSGLIGSNGAINVGGSGNSDVATINIADLPGASSLTNLLGNLTLTVGGVSAQAKQAAFGKKLADPSADCTGGTYQRVSDADQAGSYQFANLTLSATSPLLATLGSTLTSTLATAIANFSTAANALPGGLISVSGLPTEAELTQDFTASVADGGITANLANGSLTIDLAKILESAGLDINNLCPNTSLVSYLADALADLPSALDGLVTGLASRLAAALGNVTISVGGQALSDQTLTGLITAITGSSGTLTSNLSTVTGQLNTALRPAIAAISDNLLDLSANAQEESDGAFTIAALLLKLIPNGGSLPTVPGLPTFTGLPATPIPALRRAAPSSTSAPSSSAGPNSHSSVKLASARFAAQAAARPQSAVLAAAPAGTPVLELNLALAAVTNTAPTAVATPTPTPSTTVAASAIPTGVPAGAAGHNGGSLPALPIVLVLVGLVLAGGGVSAYRFRRKFSH